MKKKIIEQKETTVRQLENSIKDNFKDELECFGICSLDEMKTGYKHIVKHQGKKLKKSFVEMSFMIPKDIGTTIPQVIGSDYRLLLVAVKLKKRKSKK